VTRYMAAMALQPPSTEPERLPMPSRNPLPLSASQEAQVRDIFYARVRSHCGPEIKGKPFVSPPSSRDSVNLTRISQHSPTAPWAAPSPSRSPVENHTTP
jgi:hypothetical protein